MSAAEAITDSVPAVAVNDSVTAETSCGPSEFEQLVEAARSGDNDAMARLIGQYESEVMMVARARLGQILRPYTDSIDLVQSVHRSMMVGLARGRFEINTREQLLALATTIVRRKIARKWRTNKRQRRFDDPNIESPFHANHPDSEQIDPATIASARDQVTSVLDRLEGTDREIVRLRMEGSSTADAARRLGLDPDVTRVRLSRLRRRLREAGVDADLV